MKLNMFLWELIEEGINLEEKMERWESPFCACGTSFENT